MKALVAFVMLVPGPALLGIYSLIVRVWPDWALVLSSQHQAIGRLVAGSSLTLLGILAGTITLLFTISYSEAFKRYKRRGHLNVLFMVYGLAIIVFALSGLLALGSMSAHFRAWIFYTMLCLFVDGVIMAASIAWIIKNLAHQAHNTPKEEASSRSSCCSRGAGS